MVEATRPPVPAAAAAPVEIPANEILVKETPAPAFALPMFATLSAAPPSLPSTSPAFADAMQDIAPAAAPTTEPVVAAEPAELEPSEPIAEPVPLPRAKRHAALRTTMTMPVPLPRPKPADIAPEPDLPAVDRHNIN
jgi:hypothetical protein